MSEAIHIDDLHEPRLSEAARAALDRVQQIPFEFSAKAILEEARRDCDVPFYEDGALLARLEDYVDAVSADRHYSRMGRYSTYNALKRQLIHRGACAG